MTISFGMEAFGSKVNKLFEFSIKTLNTTEYIESNIQNIERNRIYWIEYSKDWGTKNGWFYHLVCMRKHTYRVILKEFLKLFKCLASSGIHTISRWLDLLFKVVHQEGKIRKGENSHKACMGT